jgi:hypothetical protein
MLWFRADATTSRGALGAPVALETTATLDGCDGTPNPELFSAVTLKV